ncbi:PaaI family thioesterase [uncultured Sphingomonas sp.]|uniref:PaaI family thioesterase n=1 Tax=uncultured Sphingomonas sp. TaxID=158754 RepID=UPI0025D703F0|nr:PaaI family thioesterase [uncultured Sphingomonas sp.]
MSAPRTAIGQAMVLPPYAQWLGCSIDWVEGHPQLVLPFGDHVMGWPGLLQGGAIAGLLEVAGIAALTHRLAQEGGGRIKPVTITTDYLRTGRDQHATHAVGTILRLGQRTANVEAVAWQEDRDRPIATAHLNYRVLRG